MCLQSFIFIFYIFTKESKSGCLFKDKRVVFRPPLSPTNHSQECINKLLSPNSKASLENNLAAHSATLKLFETSPGFSAC